MREEYAIEQICEGGKHVWALFLNKPFVTAEDPSRQYEGTSFVYAEDGHDYSILPIIGVWSSPKPIVFKAKCRDKAVNKFRRFLNNIDLLLAHMYKVGCGL